MAEVHGGAVDPRYEFDAPQYYDFDARSTGSVGSEWFQAQENVLAQQEAAGPSGKQPLRDVGNEVDSAAAGGGAGAGEKLKPVKVPLKAKTKAKPGHMVVKSNKLSKVLQPRRVLPTRSVKQLTVPQDVELHTTKRAQAHAPKPEPKLVTTGRTRPSVFKPREIVEEEEMAQMPVFKASTLNPLILSHSGLIGVPKVDKREVTEPQPFHFVSDDRAEARRQRMATTGAGPSGQQADEEGRKCDKAENELHKKARKSVAYNPTKVEEPKHEFHARPLPKFIGAPSVELHASHGSGSVPAPTQPAPFKLATEQRGAQHRTALASKLAAEEDEARRARVPRANGLPLSTDMPLVPPKPEPRHLTIPEPFGLACEARPMWRGVPFRIHESETVLTVPEEVPLATSSRAVEREAFNKAIDDKWKEQELAAQLAAQEARMREEEERRQLRKAAVFHARPMPDLSAPPTTKPPPAKPLTKPISPKLGRSKRSKGAAVDKKGDSVDK
ncbi:hypothetical protein GPECTOR_42g844 [Gonium pectorale]|uniref:TPX2 C-terminal domain-containing protein n=1 Tax=Gonium pectorale TaxID=33097 RepID=A0A150GA35_GONPE|nr:hypothetical protein GPECTOR_42g844 [Gonium pectorale]|eukprot:KXZ46633.1 hypothetical protein GPECTOR_42g844 [Gonium pectorale]